MASARLNGVNLHYEVEGDGPAVLFIHGRGGHHLAWFQQVPDLSKDHKVITLDLRGYGLTQVDEGQEYSLATHSGDIAALIEHLGLENVHIVGQAMGGYGALELALGYSEKVAGVVLSSSPAGLNDGQVIEGVEKTRKHYATIPYPDRNFRPWFSERWPELTYMWGKQRDNGPPFPAEYLDPLWNGGGPTAAELARFNVPTLLTAGQYDCVLSVEVAERMAALIPGATVEIVEDSGHCVYYERPQRYNQLIREFVARTV